MLELVDDIGAVLEGWIVTRMTELGLDQEMMNAEALSRRRGIEDAIEEQNGSEALKQMDRYWKVMQCTQKQESCDEEL